MVVCQNRLQHLFIVGPLKDDIPDAFHLFYNLPLIQRVGPARAERGLS